MRTVALCLSLLCLGLAACQGGRDERPLNAALRASVDFQTSVTNKADLPSLHSPCDWIETFKLGEQYYALSDTGARYFLAMLPAGELAAQNVVIDGEAPEARYFSLHTYNGHTHRVDSLADHEILKPALLQIPLLQPDQPAEYTIRAGKAYQLQVSPTQRPEQREKQTLYAGQPLADDALLSRRFLLYRVYDAAGDPSLPRLSLQTDNGLLAFSQLEDSQACAAHHQQQQQAFTQTGNNAEPANSSSGRFFRFVGLNDGSEGSFVNDHIEYMFARPLRIPSRVYWVRAKAPRWMRPSLLGLAKVETRFWSLCQNPRTAMPVAGCINDHEAQLDSDGYFNVLISTEEDKPSQLLNNQAVDWLPWGEQDAALTVYRQMLHSPRYQSAIAHAQPGLEAFSMGLDYPRARSCSTQQLNEASSTDLEALFLSCERYP